MKLVSAVSVTIFSLFVCFTGVFAWFTTKTAVDNNATTISVEKAGEFEFDYELYYFDNKNNQVVCKTEDTGTVDLSLQAFDTSISEDNSKFNNILRFQVDFTRTDSTKVRKIKTNFKSVSTTIGKTYYASKNDGATRTYADKYGYMFSYSSSEKTGQFICDNLSNIIQFKGFAYSYKIGNTTNKIKSKRTIDYTSATTIYNSATTVFNSLTSKSTFFKDGAKRNSFTFTYDDIPGGAESVEYFVEYNYNTDLLNEYFKNNEYIQNRDFDDEFDPTKIDLNITFLKDINYIQLSTELYTKEE